MYHPQERRFHDRVTLACPFVLDINGNTCRGKTRNISPGGALLHAAEGETLDFTEGQEGVCVISYDKSNCEFPCRLIRIAGLDIAAQFTSIDFEQNIFLMKLLQE